MGDSAKSMINLVSDGHPEIYITASILDENNNRNMREASERHNRNINEFQSNWTLIRGYKPGIMMSFMHIITAPLGGFVEQYDAVFKHNRTGEICKIPTITLDTPYRKSSDTMLRKYGWDPHNAKPLNIRAT